jgi:hypothetical protein
MSPLFEIVCLSTNGGIIAGLTWRQKTTVRSLVAQSLCGYPTVSKPEPAVAEHRILDTRIIGADSEFYIVNRREGINNSHFLFAMLPNNSTTTNKPERQFHLSMEG